MKLSKHYFKYLSCLFFIHLSFFATTSYAIDSSRIFVDSSFNDLPEVKNLIENEKKILNQYGFNAALFQELLENVGFRLISEDLINYNESCEKQVHHSSLHYYNSYRMISCQYYMLTWIQRSSFENFLATKDYEKIFELTLYNTFSQIAHITNEETESLMEGAIHLKNIFNDQKNAIHKNSLREISPSDLTIINNMKNVIIKYNLFSRVSQDALPDDEIERLQSSIIITKHGGVVAKNAKLSKSAIIGVGAIIAPNSIVKDNVVILGSIVSGKIYEKRENNDFIPIPPTIIIEPNTKIINSTYNYRQQTHLYGNTLFENSNIDLFPPTFLSHSNYQLKNDLTVINSDITGDVVIGERVKIKNSKIKFHQVKIEDDVKIVGLLHPQFESEEQTLLASIMSGFQSGKFIFANNSVFNFEQSQICDDKNNHFKLKHGQTKNFINADDFKDSCSIILDSDN